MHLSEMQAENNHSEKMKLAISVGRKTVEKRKAKSRAKGAHKFNFGEYKVTSL